MMSISPSSTKRAGSGRRWAATLLAGFCCFAPSGRGQTEGLLEEQLGITPAPVMQAPSRLDEWKALTTPQGGHYPAARYAAFLRLKPAWPLQKRIEWRYEHALLAETDERTRRTLCPAFPITHGDLLIACAPFLPDLPSQARRLWQGTPMDPTTERLFLTRFAPYLGREDELHRYTWLERTGSYETARRQAERLPASLHPLLMARLANRFGTSEADSLFRNIASTRDSGTHDEGLAYYRLKYLRLHERLDEAGPLWAQMASPHALHAPLPAPTNLQWQDERTAFARALLQSGNADAARASLTLLEAAPPAQRIADLHLLAGYVALTLFHDPARARPHFQALVNESDLNKRATGLYWLARLWEKTHQGALAMAAYKQAAAFPSAFYGQLALARLTHAPFLTTALRPAPFLAALQGQLARLPAPPSDASQPRPDLANAATHLAGEGDLMNATLFLTLLQASLKNDMNAQAAIARLSLSLHLPKAAILAARQMERLGITCYPAGYPLLHDLPPSSLPAGLLPALLRQESSLDTFAISPRHAFGLAQLLLPTAMQTARRHKLPYRLSSPLALLDPATNLTLGSLYLEDLHTRFGGNLPHALAAYNAGPARSQQWQDRIQRPASLPKLDEEDALLHWLILLPSRETRSYIEHIEADMSLYVLIRNRQDGHE